MFKQEPITQAEAWENDSIFLFSSNDVLGMSLSNSHYIYYGVESDSFVDFLLTYGEETFSGDAA